MQLSARCRATWWCPRSLAAGCAPAVCTAAEIRTDALQWIQRVRGAGLEGRFLHVVAAGNIYRTSRPTRRPGSAATSSRPPRPRCRSPTSPTRSPSRTRRPPTPQWPILPVCLHGHSKRGGDISTVGNDIKSLAGPGIPRDLPLGGTSSAAPQLAGAAAALWALAPALTPAQVAGILRATARPVELDTSDPRCDGRRSPRRGSTPTPPRSPPTAPPRSPRAPRCSTPTATARSTSRTWPPSATRFVASVADGVVDLDYGRFDLNGDGYTGGGRDRIDLDATSPVTWLQPPPQRARARDRPRRALRARPRRPLPRGERAALRRRRRSARHVRRAVLPAAGEAHGRPGVPGHVEPGPDRAAAGRRPAHRPRRSGRVPAAGRPPGPHADRRNRSAP